MLGDTVSIIIPVYNVKDYLDRCLRSAVGQTYKQIEIILVDDGSNDGSAQMCDLWAIVDGRIKVIHKENEGLGHARNTGLENATGKYICFLDSDDYFREDTVENALKLIEKEKADVAVFGLSRLSEDGTLLKKLLPPANRTVFEGSAVQRELLPKMMRGEGYPFSACACMFSAELIKRTAWRFVSERDIMSEDSYSLTELFSHVSRAAVLSEIGYFYVLNPGSLTQKVREDRFERIKEFYFQASELCERLGYSEDVEKALARLFFSMSLGAAKQIALLPDKAKRKALLQALISDETLAEALKKLTDERLGLKLKLLIFTIKNKMYPLSRLFISAWARIKG